ncbi:MAG: gliding motility-associated C-terminal domain-containing protein [Rhizobacter sp.]|nr:gliding motility-associated C-terminal domain-containing protein [Ferruginibacter sp.]
MIKQITIFFLILFCGYSSMAQAPVNDDPCAAITLTPTATCTYQNFTTVNATTSTGLANPGCAGVQYYDVWFQVTVPAGGALTFDSQTGTMTDGGMAIYSGDCNTMTLIECDDDDSPNGNMPMITRSGLTPGSTVLIRFWRYSGTATPPVFGTFGICVTFPPPPPANDNCAGVITAPVNPGTACTQTLTGTTQSATPTTGVPAPTCSATGINDDVWYSFVATNTIHTVSLSNVTGTSTGMAIQVYGGTGCAALTNLQCATGNTLNVAGLVTGQTYYVRIFTATATAGLYANYTLCISTPPPPPANDDPCAAITLNPTATCTYQTFTTVSATTSTGFPAPGCANFQGNDVWFQTTVPASGTLIIDAQTGGITDGGMAIYSGDCNTMVLIECDDDDSPNGNMPTIVRTGLTPGATIFIRFWEYGGDANGTFGICVTFPPPPPANDNCAGAINLPVNADLNCVQTLTGTTQSATLSAGAPTPACSAAGLDDDVWYSFTATNTAHRITLTNLGGTSTAMAIALYSGTACGSLTYLDCINGNTLTVGSLALGQTYFVRIYTTATTAISYASFTICVGIPPPPPANDDPCDAVTITVNENNTCNFQQFTNASATGTSGVPAPGCAIYAGGDVWFKVIVPCTGRLDLDANTGVMTDGGMAIYSGTTCSALTLLECNDDGSNNGLMPKISRSGLTAGSTIWIRFWEYENDNNGTFSLCASTTIPPITLPGLPASPNCALAQPLCTSTTPYIIPNISGQTPTNAPGGGIYGCLAQIPNPTYYVLNIQTAGNIQLTISQTNNAGAGVDVDFVVWGPFASAAAGCTGISAANIVDCSFSADPIEEINIPNALAGQVYILLVTNFGNQAGMITYQQTGGIGSSSCCPISAANSAALYCQGPGSVVNLFSTAVPNASYIWTGPNCYTSTQQNPTAVPVPGTPGQYIYTVTAYTATGQVCADTTIITVLPKPSIGADTSFKICAGSTANLAIIYNTATLTPIWTLNGGAVANPAAVNVSGIYRLIAANSTGCADTAFVNLTVDTVRSEVSVAQIVCTQTGRITVSNLSGISPFEYSLSSPGNTPVFQSSNEFIAPAGTYTVTTRDSLGCIGTNQVTVTIVPEVTVNAGPDVSIVTGETVQLLATVSEPASGILWTPATGLNATNILNPKANPVATTTYTIAVTNSLGCNAEDDITVIVIPYCIMVKNAFTPNGDGINDTWQIYDSYECLRNVTVHIFNRYGNKIYESRDYRNLWQGTYNNKPVPDGTYYAVVDFTLISGRKITIKSDLTILR